MNWHEPILTPSQGFYLFLFCLAVYALGKIILWLLAEPEQDTFAEPHGDVPHMGGRNG